MNGAGLALLLVSTLALCLAVAPADGADVFAPTDDELSTTAAMLTVRMAPTDAAWRRVASRKEIRDTVAKAETLLSSPLPDIPDALYLDYSRTGNRRRCEAVLGDRRGRLPILVIAECAERKGRFVPAIGDLARALCAEKSWVLPAHDGSLQTFRGEAMTIDLASADLSSNLGAALRLLGDRLPSDVRALIRSELERRTFEPYRRMCAARQGQAWLVSRMNWNSVCLDGVTGAALLALDDPRERAWFALAARHYSRYALEGFTPDGYCDEGVGYWNYGFGHYASLAETLRRATGGAMDLMARKEAVMPSAYGFRVEIVPGITPAFADCSVNAAPSQGILDYLSRRYLGKGLLRSRQAVAGGLYDQVIALFPQDAPPLRPEIAWPSRDPLRTWFPDHSVLIARPATGSACRLSIALQGGHNAQNHNHNDVGVFMVVVDGTAVLPDIGAEVYTRRTFSMQRYESPALNSWGHAVPVIGGRLQKSGRTAEARVLSKDFGPQRDRVTFDIRSAYDVSALTKLERTYEFERTGAGTLLVSDVFEFDDPTTYETALLTFGTWERLDGTTLRVTDGGQSVRVAVRTPEGATLDIAGQRVEADLTAGRTATRIGLKLRDPLRSGAVSLTITPEPGT
jgi:hypothetical protein